MEICPVHLLKRSDEQSILDLIARIGWNEAQANGQVESIGHFLKDSNACVYFAQNGEMIHAFITCQFTSWNRLGQIHGLVVDPDCRRQNLASRLVQKAETFLLEKGARGVYVDTPVDNLGGKLFYEACGYHAGYIMPEYYDYGKDGITYQKFFR